MKRSDATGDHAAHVKDAISEFDSYARQVVKQLTARIPMTPDHKQRWTQKLFHNIRARADELKAVFDLDIFISIPPEDRDFALLMFYRRHVYEHNGGEVDERYLKESGDTSVKLKQVIHETSESTSRIAQIIQVMASNIHQGFHSIFPPEDLPIKMFKIKQAIKAP
jgi:hypothetical protein